MRRIFVIILVLLVSFVFAASAVAANQGRTAKLTRGAKNLGLGWTELPKSIVDTTKGSNVIAGLTVGTLKGVAQAVARTVSGAVDVVTFPMAPNEKPLVKPSMIPEATK